MVFQGYKWNVWCILHDFTYLDQEGPRAILSEILCDHQKDKRSCTKQSPTEYNFFQISDEWTHLEFTQEKKWIWSCLLFFMCYTGMHEVMWSWFEDGILHSNILHNRYSWVQEKGKEGKANRSFHETCFFKEKKRPLERFLFYGMSK